VYHLRLKVNFHGLYQIDNNLLQAPWHRPEPWF